MINFDEDFEQALNENGAIVAADDEYGDRDTDEIAAHLITVSYRSMVVDADVTFRIMFMSYSFMQSMIAYFVYA